MAANVILFGSGAMPGSGRGSKIIQNGKKYITGVCLIVFGGLSLVVFYGYVIKGVTKKLDDSFPIVFFWRLSLGV